MRMRLGIDLDGVVANFVDGWIMRYNMEFGTNITRDQAQDWQASSHLTHFKDVSDFWDWAGASGNGPTIFRNLETYPGALETLDKLAACNDIVILSMKPNWACHDTFSWIAEKRIPTREVHFIKKKWEIECDIYLDDSPFVLPKLAKHRPDAMVCRFIRPWNEPVEGTIDIASWDDFCAMVEAEKDDRDCEGYE